MLKVNINKIYFALALIVIISFSVFEIHFLLYLSTFLIYYSTISKKLIQVVSFLLIIVITAAISSVFNENLVYYDWIKDLAYFIRPVLALLAGYFIAKKINNFKSVLKIIVFVSFFFAIIHILKIVILVDFETASVSDMRFVGGISNEIETFSIMVLITSYKFKDIEIIANRVYKKIMLVIFIISFSFYLSRTMIVSLSIFLLASYGYLKLTKKGIKYGFLVFACFGLFYGYLYSRDIERDKPGIDSFLYKMKIAPLEIFSPIDNINTKNHSMLWDRWRAYEASMAIKQLNTNYELFFGKGLGSLIDLKFEASLGEKNIRYIPILHNGYVNLLYKSGILGVLIYMILLIFLYLFSYSKTNDIKKRFANNLIGGFAVFYMFTSLIVTGMYNIMEQYVIILGMLFYFSLNRKSI